MLSLVVCGCSNAALSDGSGTAVTDLVKGILLLPVGMVP